MINLCHGYFVEFADQRNLRIMQTRARDTSGRGRKPIDPDAPVTEVIGYAGSLRDALAVFAKNAGNDALEMCDEDVKGLIVKLDEIKAVIKTVPNLLPRELCSASEEPSEN